MSTFTFWPVGKNDFLLLSKCTHPDYLMCKTATGCISQKGIGFYCLQRSERRLRPTILFLLTKMTLPNNLEIILARCVFIELDWYWVSACVNCSPKNCNLGPGVFQYFVLSLDFSYTTRNHESLEISSLTLHHALVCRFAPISLVLSIGFMIRGLLQWLPQAVGKSAR